MILHLGYFRILTGSFDKTVKIWTADGKPIHKLDNFISTVSGICYVVRSKTVWVAAGTSYASLFDPKSGDNVSPEILLLHFVSEILTHFSWETGKRVIGKQCKPRSDAAERGV